mmetsp:Transcript_1591/g.5465  ORF Transcript_1591/g.5465 Transcript_1591/m.5465 type:complete len:314 (+) Transcript_1591:428-1369(+)
MPPGRRPSSPKRQKGCRGVCSASLCDWISCTTTSSGSELVGDRSIARRRTVIPSEGRIGRSTAKRGRAARGWGATGAPRGKGRGRRSDLVAATSRRTSTSSRRAWPCGSPSARNSEKAASSSWTTCAPRPSRRRPCPRPFALTDSPTRTVRASSSTPGRSQVPTAKRTRKTRTSTRTSTSNAPSATSRPSTTATNSRPPSTTSSSTNTSSSPPSPLTSSPNGSSPWRSASGSPSTTSSTPTSSPPTLASPSGPPRGGLSRRRQEGRRLSLEEEAQEAQEEGPPLLLSAAAAKKTTPPRGSALHPNASGGGSTM